MISRISLLSCLVITLIACRPNENNGSKSTIELDRTEQMKQELYLNLNELINAGRFLFGQQRSTLSGVGEMGGNPWGDERYGTQADSEKLVGDRPAILGMDVWDYAMKNPTWNQPAYAQAVRDFYQNGKGGLVSFDWHMRGCDIGDVYDAGGNHGVPGDGFKIDNWDSDSNRSCLCRIVNEEPWTNGKTWKDWLYTQKLDKFSTKLQSEGLDQVPMIFRPFHEMNGSWFWWGSKSWDCQKHLGRSNVISGVEAYKKLFRMSVDYLRKDRNIHNMLIAFSPDRLCKHEGHSCDASAAQNDKVSDQDLYNDFMRLYPGSQYVDILGLDLYYAADTGQVWEKPDYQSKIFTQNLKTISRVARDEGKIAALTETGNYNLHNEVNKSSDWFNKYLLPLITADKDIKITYAMTWENRSPAMKEYYIPFIGHAGYQDFKSFVTNAKTIMYSGTSGIFDENFRAGATKTKPAKQSEKPNSYPLCSSASADADGDGWGWEYNRSCQVRRAQESKPDNEVLFCKDFNSDPDGDGWGWENSQSCKIFVCSSRSFDPDGDGWGWENNKTCKVR